MSDAIELVDRTRFLPLPHPETAEGTARRVGVEIEFGGLDEGRAARIVAETLGGSPECRDSHSHAVTGTALGDVEVYLDTALRDMRASALRDKGLDLGREVIPVEIVTAPFDPAELPRLETLATALRDAGARGSRGGLLLGFGVHLNVEIAAPAMSALLPVATAFAVLEDWLRFADPMDGARRLLPFTDPWPRRFVRRLVALHPGAGLAAFCELYLTETPTRNRALDLLPLLLHLDPERMEGVAAGSGKALAPRPAFHYRLPDCRIDEADWTLAYEWNRWRLVESVAEDSDLRDELIAAWQAHDASFAAGRQSWAQQVDARLVAHLRAEAAG